MEITTDKLKEYIGNIYKLEVSLYNQRAFFARIQDEINRLSAYTGQELELTYSTRGYIKIGGIIGGAVFGGSIGTLISVFGLHANTPERVFRGMAVGAGIGILIVILNALYEVSIAKANNKKINKSNQQISMSNERGYKVNDQKIFILSQELSAIRKSYSKTKFILDKYYEKNIIYPKYRNLVAVSSIYEYFLSGRCSCLKGHEGAYNLFELESRQNIIINKLDEVILHLERIENNQHMLYSAIQDGNSKTERLSQEISQAADNLQRIENNTKITAYNSSITAQNTEFLKWIEIFRD